MREFVPDEDRWYHGYTPVNINDDMKSCLGSLNGIGVVRRGFGISGTYEKPACPYVLISMSWDQYNVFACPPEETETIEKGFKFPAPKQIDFPKPDTNETFLNSLKFSIIFVLLMFSLQM